MTHIKERVIAGIIIAIAAAVVYGIIELIKYIA